MFNLKRKVLFGVSVSMVLAMAVGSFAISETQTPARPRMVKTQSAVSASSSVGAGAFTVTATDGETVLTNSDYSYDSGVLTIKSTTPMTIKNTNTGSTTDRIKVDLTSDSEANITLDGVNINTDQGAAFEIKDDATFNVNITLADDSKNTLTTTANNYAGLQKNGSGDSIGTLIIGVPDGSAGTGKLEATGGRAGAGIGGGTVVDVKNITITGGKVTATGGSYASGIGNGYTFGASSGGNTSYIYITGILPVEMLQQPEELTEQELAAVRIALQQILQ